MNKKSVVAEKEKKWNGILKKGIYYACAMFTLFLLLFASVVFAEEPVQLASISGLEASAGRLADFRENADMPQGIDADACAETGFIQAVIEGPTELEFWWRGSDRGRMIFYMDGVQKIFLDGDTGWKKTKVSVKEEGVQVIQWVYAEKNKAGIEL